MKVVLDTNVLVGALIVPQSTGARIMRYRHLFTVMLSAEIISELRRVLDYPHIAQVYRLTHQNIADYVRKLRYTSQVVDVYEDVIGISADPDDDKFLSCALSAKADLIVSADSDLYELMAFRGIPIMQPYQFLEFLQEI